MRTETVTESKTRVLSLTSAQAEALRMVGRRLASDRSWWGANPEDEATSGTVIRCDYQTSGKYRVRVADAVGVVAVDDLQLHVQPKIPVNHFMYILEAADHVPRIDEQHAQIASGHNFVEILARWFVTSAEGLLRRDLVRDYTHRRDFLSAKRGRLLVQSTARAFYSGRIGFDCEFDEFDIDTPLNRLVKSASRRVAAAPMFDRQLRRRASSVVAHMDEVGPLRHADLRAKPGRRTAHYRRSVSLARQILRWQGRLLGSGIEDTWAFLIRTPELVEEGLRSILSEALAPHVTVSKKGIQIGGSKMTFNPDVIFDDGRVIADVKYKIPGRAWSRPDLYQVISFARAYGATRAAVFAFSDTPGVSPPSLTVGDLAVDAICWTASPDTEPEDAATAMCEALSDWVGVWP